MHPRAHFIFPVSILLLFVAGTAWAQPYRLDVSPVDDELAEVSAEGLKTPPLTEQLKDGSAGMTEEDKAQEGVAAGYPADTDVEYHAPPVAQDRLDLSAVPRHRGRYANGRLTLGWLPGDVERDQMDDEHVTLSETRGMEIGGIHMDTEVVENLVRHGLRMTHDMGQDTILELGLIQPRTARTSAGRSVTTVGMRLQLNPSWELHAGYGAAFGSGMRAQVGLSWNW